MQRLAISNLLLLYLYIIFLLTKDEGIFYLMYICLALFLIFNALFLTYINVSHFAISSIKSIISLQIIYLVTTINFWQKSYPAKLEDIGKMEYKFISSFKCLTSIIEIFVYFFLILLIKFLSKRKILKNFSNEIIFLHFLVIFYNVYQCHYHIYHAPHQWFAFILGWFSWVAPISLIHILYCSGISMASYEKNIKLEKS